MRDALPHPAVGHPEPWYRRDGGRRLARDRMLVAQTYPMLVYQEEAGYLELRGQLAYPLECGLVTQIGVRVVFPDQYPVIEPTAFDSDGRFPVELDRHLLEGGRCCLWLPPRSRWNSNNPETLRVFLDEVAIFFDRQLIYEATGRWPGGEYPHRREGYEQFLREELGVDEEGLRQLAPAVLGRVHPALMDDCPCGSQRKFKRCHRAAIFNIQHTLTPAFLGAILETNPYDFAKAS